MTNTVYVGVTNRTGGSVSGLYRRREDRDTWEFCDAMVGAFPSRIMRMGIAPQHPDVIWAGMEVNGAMRSDDGAESWTDLNDNLVVLSPAAPRKRPSDQGQGRGHAGRASVASGVGVLF